MSVSRTAKKIFTAKVNGDKHKAKILTKLFASKLNSDIANLKTKFKDSDMEIDEFIDANKSEFDNLARELLLSRLIEDDTTSEPIVSSNENDDDDKSVVPVDETDDEDGEDSDMDEPTEDDSDGEDDGEGEDDFKLEDYLAPVDASNKRVASKAKIGKIDFSDLFK